MGWVTRGGFLEEVHLELIFFKDGWELKQLQRKEEGESWRNLLYNATGILKQRKSQNGMDTMIFFVKNKKNILIRMSIYICMQTHIYS